MVDAAELAAIPLFSSLEEADLREVGGWFEEQSAGEGVPLTGEGSVGYKFFVLRDGSASVSADGVDLAELGPGDFFGEMALLGSGRRTATVTTTSPVKLLVMFGTEFRRMQETHPEVTARLEEAMRNRIATPD